MIWKSERTDNCTISVMHSVVPESVGTQFEFGSKSQMVILFYFEPVSVGTRINCTMNISRMSLWERYYALLQQEKLNTLIEQAIENLSSSSRELKYCRLGEIHEIQSGKRFAVIKPDTTTLAALNEAKQTSFAVLNRFLERRSLESDSLPFCIFETHKQDTIVYMAGGYPLLERNWVWQNLVLYQFPEVKTCMVSHFGGSNLRKAHTELEKYCLEKGYTPMGEVWEEYLYNPATDADTSMWETRVYMPVE